MIHPVIGLCIALAALSNAVTTLNTAPSLTAFMAAPTVQDFSSTVQLHSRMLAPSFRRVSIPNKSRYLISSTYRNNVIRGAYCAPKITPVASRSIPKPMLDASTVLMFHHQPEMFDRDTCVLSLSKVSDSSFFQIELLEILEEACGNLLSQGYSRAAIILSRHDSAYADFHEVLVDSGFQVRNACVVQPQAVKETWIKDLTEAENPAKSKSTPLWTISGAVPDEKETGLLSLENDMAYFDKRDLYEIDHYLHFDFETLKSVGHSHAAVVVNKDCRSVIYKKIVSILEEKGFQVCTPHPSQKLNIPNGELWLKKL